MNDNICVYNIELDDDLFNATDTDTPLTKFMRYKLKSLKDDCERADDDLGGAGHAIAFSEVYDCLKVALEGEY